MGRSLLQELFLADSSLFPERVLALGSTARKIQLLDGLTVNIVKASLEQVTNWRPTIGVHLAYLTADRLGVTSPEHFTTVNSTLTQFGLEMQSLPTLRAFMFASSGAATEIETNHSLASHPYSIAKAADEAAFFTADAAKTTPTLAARLWSVSGPHCTRPRDYALTDMVMQCALTGQVTVKAQGIQMRRYVDAGEFLASCLSFNLAGNSGVIDSAGELIEIRDLAQMIAKELGGRVESKQIDSTVEANLYYSDSTSMAGISSKLGIDFTDLRGQIHHTAQGLLYK